MTRRLPALLLLGCIACVDTSFKPEAIVNPDELFWSLDLNHHAVLLAMSSPYDTLTLTATPRNARGEALAGFPAPQFYSEDVTKVAVSPEGVLHAIQPMAKGTEVVVTAMLIAQNVKHVDTMYVRVADEDPLPMLDRLSIHIDPPDSAKVAVTPDYLLPVQDTLPVRAYDVNGDTIYTIPGDALSGSRGVLPVSVSLSDSTAVQLLTVTGRVVTPISGRAVGTALVYATTTALGVTRSDTIQYRTGWPLFQVLSVVPLGQRTAFGNTMLAINNIFPASDVRIGTGGMVIWRNQDTTFNADVAFADADLPNIASASPWPSYLNPFLNFLFCNLFGPSDCVNGGSFAIGPQTPNHQKLAARIFSKPGTYEYVSTQHPGSHGRIIVVDER